MGSGDLFFIIKAVLLLVVSFFVLVGVTKTESKNLKTFGRILAITLWIISAVSIIFSIYLSNTTSRLPRMHKYHPMHKMM